MTQVEKLQEIEQLIYKKFKSFINKLIQVINEDFETDVTNVTTYIRYDETIKSFIINMTLNSHNLEKLNKLADYIRDNTRRGTVFVAFYNVSGNIKLAIKIKSPNISKYIDKLDTDLDKV